MARGEVWRTNKKDGEDYPLAIFRFFYRSMSEYFTLKHFHLLISGAGALQILGVVERTPSPEPNDRSRSPSIEMIDQHDGNFDFEFDGDDMTPAERREVAALLACMKAKRKSKGKGKDTKQKMSSSGGKKIKKEKIDDERHANKRQKNNSAPPTVIVLDDDTENESDDGEGLFVLKVPDESSRASLIH